MPEFSVSLAPETAPPAVTVVANFGIVAGRQAIRAEIEKLWDSVKGVVEQATICIEDRNQFGPRTSTCVYQVSVAVAADVVERAHQDPERLQKQLEEALHGWVTACATRVEGEMTFAERKARAAVVDGS